MADGSTPVLEALRAEQEALGEVLAGLTDAQWEQPSLCAGWSVGDVVLHLAQTEEAVAALAAGETDRLPGPFGSGTTDDAMDRWVRAERGQPWAAVLDRWRTASEQARRVLFTGDPDRRIQWVTNTLKPATLATTRLAEHWTHALDVTEPLGLPYPDTDRLRHVAWLAHRTLPYAYARAGRDDAPPARLELTSPGGEPWQFGPVDAEVSISGPAGVFCRVAAQRLAADDASALDQRGERATEVLKTVRTYA
ncbi:maleylpyruvate isomerase family mycothiol-dependent enzyme [Phytoactinopolyspora limicola]|uniref:maleylpyruvate isomerase family mycothiol-dependent enzyme n=1 Tax=Phytoactinopolyspora limicola TaxID=2715536 RepID=UPI00140E37B9|nr:maleylpyruvate isomerase family mycothiol-dependent enzyme [Phytoactinopolyspora limicola]